MSRLCRHIVFPVHGSAFIILRASWAALCGSLGCVTLHAVGSEMGPITIMPHARGRAPIEHDQPATRQSGVTIDEDGRVPRVAAIFSATIPMRL